MEKEEFFYKKWWFWVMFFFFLLCCITDPNETVENSRKSSSFVDKKSEISNNESNKTEEKKKAEKKKKTEKKKKAEKKKKVDEKKKVEEQSFGCMDDSTYMLEYDYVFEKLYPYGHKVSIWDWNVTGEWQDSCQYHTTIKINNAFGASSKHHLYINTILDKANRKEKVKNLIIDNIVVYEREGN